MFILSVKTPGYSWSEKPNSTLRGVVTLPGTLLIAHGVRQRPHESFYPGSTSKQKSIMTWSANDLAPARRTGTLPRRPVPGTVRPGARAVSCGSLGRPRWRGRRIPAPRRRTRRRTSGRDSDLRGVQS